MKQNYSIFVIILLVLGVTGDGILSGISILDLFDVKTLYAWVITVTGGLIITGFTASTKYALSQKLKLVKLLWFGAVLLDIYTTFYGTKEILINNNGPEFLSYAISAYLAGASLSSSYIYDSYLG